KTDFYRPEYQKRKDKICPFSSLAFFQPTTVDKEPNKKTSYQMFKNFDRRSCFVKIFIKFSIQVSC
ncbi:hypothetical protein ACRE0J_10785, partial [Streptococcus pneumoniae]